MTGAPGRMPATARAARYSGLRRALLPFGVATLVAVVVVVAAALVISERIAEDEALADASRATASLASSFSPLVTDGVRTQDPESLARLDAVVRAATAGGDVVRVKIWSEDGRVLYSDEPSLIGSTFGLAEDELAVMRDQSVLSELSDVSRPENAAERRFAPVVEVYAGARDADGRPVLVEAYFRVVGLDAARNELARNLAPAVVVPLALLIAIFLPLAVSLARRVERYERERSALVAIAAQASAAERRRVAAELHDGVIQDLSGVGYALTHVESRLAEQGDSTSELQQTIATVRAIVQGDVSRLRGMLTTLHSAAVAEPGLAEALATVARDAEPYGIRVVTDLEQVPPLPAPVREGLFKVGREALRNAVSHSGAAEIRLSLRTADDEVVLAVTDDGRGFDPVASSGRDGHLGLLLMQDAAGDIGGRLWIGPAPGRGTCVEVAVPLRGGRPAERPSSRFALRAG